MDILPLYNSLSGAEDAQRFWGEAFSVSDKNVHTGVEHLFGYTKFFRDPHILNTLCLMAENPRRRQPLRVAFAGCSIGCEPFSFILQAMDKGLFDKGRVARVDAFDKSAQFTTIARSGVYPDVAKRQIPLDIYKRYTQSSGEDGTFTFTDAVRKKLNVLPDQWLADWVPLQVYDVVVANNMLYYIHDRPVLDRSLDALFSAAQVTMFNITGDERVDALRTAMRKHDFAYGSWPLLSMETVYNRSETRIALRNNTF